MKRYMLLALLLLMGAVCCSAGAESASPSVTGPLKVTGTQLTDAAGNPVQLRGFSTHGLSWYPQYVNGALFRELRESFGCNAVRLAMYTEAYGGYCSGGSQARLKQLILDGVRYAKAADLYVIVDWHILSDGDPNTHAEEAVAFFDEISAELAGEDHVLYELCNEPNGGTEWADIRRYAEQVIPVIRSHDPDAVILIGTPEWSQRLDLAAADPITEWDNLMYTLHFYSATHRQGLRNVLKEALAAGLPVFISECGVCGADGDGEYDFTEADRWADLLDRNGISYIMWALANNEDLSCAFVSTCDKLSGFIFDDLTKGAQWLVRRLGGSLAEGAASVGITEKAERQADLILSAEAAYWVDTGSGARAEITVNERGFTVKVTDSTAERYGVQPAFRKLTLEEGGTYTLTFLISSTKKITADALLQQNYGSYRGYAGLYGLQLTPKEQEFSLTFTMDQPTDSDAALVFNIGGCGHLMYTVSISDVRLERVP